MVFSVADGQSNGHDTDSNVLLGDPANLAFGHLFEGGGRLVQIGSQSNRRHGRLRTHFENNYWNAVLR